MPDDKPQGTPQPITPKQNGWHGNRAFYDFKKRKAGRIKDLVSQYEGIPVEEILPKEAKKALLRTIARGEESYKEEVEMKADLALINKVFPDKHHTQVVGEIVTVTHSVPPMKGGDKP